MTAIGKRIVRRFRALLLTGAWLVGGGIAIVAVSAVLVTPLYLAARHAPNLYAAIIALTIMGVIGRGLFRVRRQG